MHLEYIWLITRKMALKCTKLCFLTAEALLSSNKKGSYSEFCMCIYMYVCMYEFIFVCNCICMYVNHYI